MSERMISDFTQTFSAEWGRGALQPGSALEEKTPNLRTTISDGAR